MLRPGPEQNRILTPKIQIVAFAFFGRTDGVRAHGCVGGVTPGKMTTVDVLDYTIGREPPGQLLVLVDIVGSLAGSHESILSPVSLTTPEEDMSNRTETLSTCTAYPHLLFVYPLRLM